jgi:hypothetical protein
MNGFPANLDLSETIGQSITGFFLGAWDLQFSLGKISFAIQSRVSLIRADSTIAEWKPGGWLPVSFREVFNEAVKAFAVISPKCLDLQLQNGLMLRLHDDSQHYESMQIYFGDGTVDMV